MTNALHRHPVTAHLTLGVVTLAALSLIGCAGQVDNTAIKLQTLTQTTPPAKSTGDFTVAIATFDDTTPQQGHLGSRSHLWGGTTYFDLAGGKPGEVVAQLVADYLKKRGWRVEKATSDGPASVTISGKVVALSVNATSSFGSTDITATAKTTVEAVNATDGSKVRMTLTGAGSQGVFWFDPEDAQALLGETISESLSELIANTKVENTSLRLK